MTGAVLHQVEPHATNLPDMAADDPADVADPVRAAEAARASRTGFECCTSGDAYALPLEPI